MPTKQPIFKYCPCCGGKSYHVMLAKPDITQCDCCAFITTTTDTDEAAHRVLKMRRQHNSTVTHCDFCNPR